MVADEFVNKLKQFQLKADSDLDARVHDRIDQMDLGVTTRSLWSCVRWGKWAAVLLVGALLLWPYAPRNVAWSQVAERFEAVPYVRASLNLYNERASDYQHMELWFGGQGRLRIETRSQVILAAQGEILKAVSLQGGLPVVPDRAARDVIKGLGTWQTFSLDTLIHAVLQEPLVDVTPSDDLDRSVWRDLVVFDSRSSVGSGRIRLYALRDSKLPVSFRIWDTDDGMSVEATFLYEKEPAGSFFTP
ncbi:MAG: hypothetical protein HQ515_12875 [Phycisphaeraceae bacterium]|nr:hypothetical protein [Phycisphaeraceae bacterium]